MNGMRVSLVILTLNEIDGLRAVYDRIPIQDVDEVFAVDGGSTDGTREFYRDMGLKVIDQRSRGRGEAFRIAFQHASGDALIFYSPDGNEDPTDIPKFAPLLKEGYDLVIASRMMRGARNEEDEDLFRWRKWANQMFTRKANFLWNRGGTFVTDTINGFRAINRTAFEKINLDSVGYTIEYQMSIRAMKLGLRIAEFPTFEGSRIGGESYAKSFPLGIQMLKTLWSEMWTGNSFET